MVNKLPKTLLEKLSQDEIDLIKNTYDTEAGNIRRSYEGKTVSKSEYDKLNGELNSLKKGNEVDKLIASIPTDLKDLFKDKLLASENPEEAFKELSESKKALIDKLNTQNDGNLNVGAAMKPTAKDPELLKQKANLDRVNSGLPIL